MSSLGLANMTGDYHLALHVETAMELVNLKAAVEQTYTDIDSAWLVICGENGALCQFGVSLVPRACCSRLTPPLLAPDPPIY